MNYLCPICGSELSRRERSLVCPSRHSFDIARQGYVNRLAVQQKHSLTPGDAREQVLSRRACLEAGFYQPISDALNRAALDHGASGEILDVGCGEGYYSARLAKALGAPLTGLDISKVLRGDGVFLQVLAAEDHLLGLKSIVYDELKHKQKNSVPELPGFRLAESRPIRFTFTVEGPQIRSLFAMTPHLFRIGRQGARRLAETQTLTDTASCILNVYRPG